MNEPIELATITSGIREKLPKNLSTLEERSIGVLKWVLPACLSISSLVSLILGSVIEHGQSCGISSLTQLQNVTSLLENSTLVELAPVANSMFCLLAGNDYKIVIDCLNALFAGLSVVFVFLFIKQKRISSEIERILLVNHDEITRENVSLRQSLSTGVSAAQSIAPYVPSVAMGDYGYQPTAVSLGSPAETTTSTRFPTPYEVA